MRSGRGNTKEVMKMAKKELAPQADRLPSEVYQIMDDADSELIVSSLAGKTIQKYIYDITIKGKHAYGLSVEGVEDACRYMAQHGEFIRIEDMPQVIIDDGGCLANVIARRYVKDSKTGNLVCADTALGTKYERRMKEHKDGSPWEDENFREIAVSKAARNGKSKLILEEIKIKLIEKYKKMTGKTGTLKYSDEKPPIHKDPNNIKIQQLKKELIDLAVWENDEDYREFLAKHFAGDHGEPIRSVKALSDIQKSQAIDLMMKLKENQPEKVEAEESNKASEEQLLDIRQLKESLGESYSESMYKNLTPQGADRVIEDLKKKSRKKGKAPSGQLFENEGESP